MTPRWDDTRPPGGEYLREAPPPPLRDQVWAVRRLPRQRAHLTVTTTTTDGPSSRTVVVLTMVNTVVAAGQAWAMQSGGDCSSPVCSVATLDGHPWLCLALAVSAVVVLGWGEVARAGLPGPFPPQTWAALRWAGVMASVVATIGAVVVALATALIVAAVAAVLIGGSRGD